MYLNKPETSKNGKSGGIPDKSRAKEKVHKIKCPSIPLYCGNCSLCFGPSENVGKLIFEYSEKVNYSEQFYKCLSCFRSEIPTEEILGHVLKHLKAKEMYCVKCKSDIKKNRVVYDLETDKAIEQHVSSEEKKVGWEERSKKLSKRLINTISEISPSCGNCDEKFVNIIEKFHTLYEFSCSKDFKCTWPVFCCVICGECRSHLHNIVQHVQNHFRYKKVFCKKCLDSNPNLREFSVISDSILKDKSRFTDFDTYMIVNCGKCEDKIAESAILVPRNIIRYEKAIYNGDLKILKKQVYKCLICLNTFSATEIGNHIIHHINSKHIFCGKCQNEHRTGLASLQRHSTHLDDNEIKVLCKECENPFSCEDFQSRFGKFLLKRAVDGKRSKGTEIFFCNICRTTLSKKKPHDESHSRTHFAKGHILFFVYKGKIKHCG